jgi:hypothetical protein
MTDLLALAGRVAAATAASRVLDFEIQIAVFGDAIWPATDMQGRITNPNSRMSDYLAIYRDVIDQDDQDFNFPRYTASLDAAMTLVPEGYYWTVDQRIDHWTAVFNNPDRLLTFRGKAATELQARLAAILRSRASMEAGNG